LAPERRVSLGVNVERFQTPFLGPFAKVEIGGDAIVDPDVELLTECSGKCSQSLPMSRIVLTDPHWAVSRSNFSEIRLKD